eukprot:COSAG05_NODE_1832_length_3998_cov_11.418312_7_plen_95_part_00
MSTYGPGWRTCETVRADTSSCYKHVDWAMRTGIHTNASIYTPYGLSKTSSFEQFQCALGGPMGLRDCAGKLPCGIDCNHPNAPFSPLPSLTHRP